MADSGDFQNLLYFVSLMLFLYGLNGYASKANKTLESIDKKMHTHAADGSINGIRGWY